VMYILIIYISIKPVAAEEQIVPGKLLNQ